MRHTVSYHILAGIPPKPLKGILKRSKSFTDLVLDKNVTSSNYDGSSREGGSQMPIDYSRYGGEDDGNYEMNGALKTKHPQCPCCNYNRQKHEKVGLAFWTFTKHKKIIC